MNSVFLKSCPRPWFRLFVQRHDVGLVVLETQNQCQCETVAPIWARNGLHNESNACTGRENISSKDTSRAKGTYITLSLFVIKERLRQNLTSYFTVRNRRIWEKKVICILRLSISPILRSYLCGDKSQCVVWAAKYTDCCHREASSVGNASEWLHL